ncbi:MAG TPA: NADAR family protein [Saprospiraceae bacterium]|nr:NADAR family protein [Saprospiraceae bacterium]
MSKEPEFTIPSFTDSKNGYLNIAALYKFTLDNKEWPSVEHYRLAKRFEGSILEEEIRKAKTVNLAKTLMKPRSIIKNEDGIISKEIRYGKSNTFIREDWEDKDSIFIEAAVLAKFSQNKKIQERLISTIGIHFIDKGCPYHAIALEKVRSYLTNEAKIVRVIINMPKPSDDINDKYLTLEEISLLKNFFVLCKSLKKLDSIPKETPIDENIVYDVLYNLIEERNPQRKILQAADKWIEGLSWSYITNQMPNFEKLIKEIGEYLIKNSPLPGGIPPPKKLQISMKIAAMFRWNRLEKILKRLASVDIIIPPVKRKYRAITPANILVKKGTAIKRTVERNKEYIELFQKHPNVRGDLHSKLVNYFENLKPVNRNIEIENFSKKSFDDQKAFINDISSR